MEEKLSELIVNYSIKVKENEKVLIIYQTENSKKLVKNLIKEILKVNGIPFVEKKDIELESLVFQNETKERLEYVRKRLEYDVENFDSFVRICEETNDYETSIIDDEIKNRRNSYLRDLINKRNSKRKWVLLDYPTLLDAYKAKKPYDEYKEFALNAMYTDYKHMEKNIKPLKELMEKTDKVRITGKDTDLTFSIKGLPAVPCLGEFNIPDGEIFTAPVRDSVNGVITYNTSTAETTTGHVFKNISLTFKDGKIIKATCEGDEEKLNKIFDIDEGARYIGEFALGFNPNITEPIGSILFDEKIIGSLHFTPGQSYRECNNGNDSTIHWDLVLIQREEYGGGEIYFDDVLIRKNGIFVLPELKPLNYHLNK